MSVNYAERISKLGAQLGTQNIDLAFVSPGPDLRYLTGYDAVPLERLTALVVSPNNPALLLAPFLEREAALASPIRELGLEILTWQEGQSPYEVLVNRLGSCDRFAVDARMWAEKLIHLQTAFRGAIAVSAGPAISNLRSVKSPSEIQSLRAAAAAIDEVHRAVPDLLRVGRTEAEIAKEVAGLIIQAGHSSVDFTIVAAGENSASPHHESSDRRLRLGDAIVVDIGGTMPDGYCSDCTRTYHLGEPTAEYLERYKALQLAQQTAIDAVRPGVACEDIDGAARKVLSDVGIGELFIHRVGHGIGLETHEEPYMVQGNQSALQTGNAFSIEPGFYESGKAGARIEDIVVCTQDGVEVLNLETKDLVVIN